MGDPSWQFRAHRGVVEVRGDAVVIRSTPRQFLASQRARWRHGGTGERIRAAFGVFSFVTIFASVYRLVGLFEASEVQIAVSVGSLLLLGITVWNEYGRETRISRGAIEHVTLDEDERELTIAHVAPDGLLSVFRDDAVETELSLPSAADVHEAKQILRLRSIDVQQPAPNVETEHDFVTRNGACFCVRCDRQVSPNDRTCPHCRAALRREVPVAEARRRGRDRELETD